MAKYSVVYPYSRILLDNKEASYKQLYIVWFHLYEISSVSKSGERDNRLGVVWGVWCGEGS